MTDNDLLARADAMSDLPHAPHQLIKELVAVLRARDTELATARAREAAIAQSLWDCFVLSGVDRDYTDLGWWLRAKGIEGLAAAVVDGVRDLAESYAECLDELPSVSPPADRPTAHGDPGPPPVVPRPPEEP